MITFKNMTTETRNFVSALVGLVGLSPIVETIEARQTGGEYVEGKPVPAVRVVVGYNSVPSPMDLLELQQTAAQLSQEIPADIRLQILGVRAAQAEPMTPQNEIRTATPANGWKN